MLGHSRLAFWLMFWGALTYFGQYNNIILNHRIENGDVATKKYLDITTVGDNSTRLWFMARRDP